jgi:hypothetical protein
MNYLERYRNGAYEQVWSDLQALGPAVRDEPHYSLAQAVASETMSRVRRNCERIVSRLHAAGYVFGRYPDGSRGYYSDGPLVQPSDATRAECASLEAQVGPLPLSLAAFWQEVGSVDLVGMHPGWPELRDPLVVYSPEAALSDLDYWEEDAGEGTASGQFEAGLAPDDLHKDNTSGGSPYSVALPDPSVDFAFLNERHGLLFVPYLRLAILRWGGFPGLDGRAARFEPLADLIAGLEPF